jgi:hypothetical protein
MSEVAQAPGGTVSGTPVTLTVTPGGPVTPGGVLSPIELAHGLLWPVVVLIIAILYRRSIRAFAAQLLGRVKSISLAGVEVELASGSTHSAFASSGLVDIRRSGTAQDVTDSTLAGFFAQISSRVPLEFAVVNLGEGREWLTSRLYILAVILMRMRGTRALVFVNQQNQTRGHFVGVCPSETVRWRLACEFRRYEAALAAGEQRVWYGPNPKSGPITSAAFIADDYGAFGNPDNAADLLRGFLSAIQTDIRPALAYPGEPWEELRRTVPQPGETPSLFELASWVDVLYIERLFDGALDVASIPYKDFQLADADTRRRLVLDHVGPWLPLVRDQDRFYGLVSRERLLAASVVAQAGAS